MKRILIPILIGLSAIVFLQDVVRAQELPKIHEEVSVQWWVVPVYAVGEGGKTVADLKEGDIDVFFNRKRVKSFTLVKKEFQIAEARKGQPAEREGTFVARKKLVFLVFDAALTHANQMGRAKKIAASMVARPDETSQYIVMTIEPYGGLTYLIGPDAGREAIVRTINRRVSGRKSEFLGNKYLDSENIRYASSPPHPTSPLLTPPPDALNPEPIDNRDKLDRADMSSVAASFQSSLRTLNVILGAFKDSSKVVYLFSSGLPLKMFEKKNEYELEDGDKIVTINPEALFYRSIQTFASTLNRNGALLFVVNPGGTRINSNDPESGEMSLRVMADESGGRYYAGTEKEVTSDVTAMERAYYEIYFSDAPELKGPEFRFDVSCRTAGIKIYSLKKLARGKEYADMTPLEREVLMLDVVQNGYYSQVKLKPISFTLSKKGDVGGEAVYPVPIPDEIVGSQLDLYKVWISREKNDVKMELERLTPRAAEMEVRMKPREGYRLHVVLFHPGTRMTLVGGE